MNDQKGFSAVVVVIIIAVIVAGGIAYIVSRPDTNSGEQSPTSTVSSTPTSSATLTPVTSVSPETSVSPTSVTSRTEQQIITELKKQWSSIERPLFGETGESGHWGAFSMIQFIGPSTFLINFDNGLDDANAILRYQDGVFTKLKSYGPGRLPSTEWNKVVTMYGTKNYTISNYSSPDYQAFSKTNENLFAEMTINVPLLDQVTDSNPRPKVAKQYSSDFKLFYVPFIAPYSSAVLNATYTALLRTKNEAYDDNNNTYTTALSVNTLNFEKVTLENGVARVYLKGTFSWAGDLSCDYGKDQIEYAAKQYSTVKSVSTYLNGTLIDWSKECSLK